MIVNPSTQKRIKRKNNVIHEIKIKQECCHHDALILKEKGLKEIVFSLKKHTQNSSQTSKKE